MTSNEAMGKTKLNVRMLTEDSGIIETDMTCDTDSLRNTEPDMRA